jgi:single-strand DNA-binding protein
MFLNKAMVFGNLTRDPELKALPSGIKVCSFSLATNRVWKDQAGAKKEAADFHNIVVFGKSAELINQYMRKGSSIFVEGRMQTRSWDDKDGKKQYRTEVVADSFQFGPKAGVGGMEAPAKDFGGAKEPAGKKMVEQIEYPEEEINPEDIPF